MIRHDEFVLQHLIVTTLRSWGMVVFSVPNERNAGVSDAVRMRATGLTKGAPDLVCWLELKTPTGKRSPEQECMEDVAHRIGVEYKVVRSIDDIKDIEYWSSPVI